MVVDDLVRSPGSWLSMRRDTGIVISSRIRLARNLKDEPFPGWAGDPDRIRICSSLLDLFRRIPDFEDALFFDMSTIAAVDREVLQERHLISHDLAARPSGSALVLSRSEQMAIMINEEDHLRMQAFSPGMGLMTLLKRLDQVDTRLESHVEFAFDVRLGYLTACPSNLGTGLRASVMMHLSGLRLMDEIEPVIKGLDKLGIAVRGLLGEGTDAYGNLFQISNQTTLGDSEAGIVQRLTRIVEEVAVHEENARARLWESRRNRLEDHVARSLGLMLHARLMPSREAVDLLSGLRIGVDFGLVSNLTVAQINEIMILIQPGHLQKMTGRVIDSDERDALRAGVLHKKLKHVTMAA